MRKIEAQMNAAIQKCISWQSSNTRVEYIEENDTSKVYLHGNHIATVGDNFLEVFDGGWQSVTTKSRLNALCSEFCIAGEGVFQRNFKWFVHKLVGQSSVTGKVFNEEEFVNGYIFA